MFPGVGPHEPADQDLIQAAIKSGYQEFLKMA